MRSRAPALVAVVVFAVAVALIAVFAGQGGGDRLVKLPAGSSTATVTDEAAPASGDLSTRSSLPYPGSVEYKVDGTLPELPSEAPGYRLGSATTAAGVARLAASLGVAGDVQADATGWVVSSGGRQLRVERVAGLPWYLGPACPDVPVRSEADEDVVTTCAVALDTPAATAGGGSTGSAAGCANGGCTDVAIAPAPVPECSSSTDCVAPAPRLCEGAGASCTSPPTHVCDGGTPQCVPQPTAVCEGGTLKCVPRSTPVCDGATLKCALRSCESGAACAEPAAPPVPTCPPDAKCVAPDCAPDLLCVFPVPPEPVRPADLPTKAEAGRLALKAFAALGVGTDGMVVEDGWTAWYARVEMRVDGLGVIGMDTSVSIGPKGEIVGGNGYLVAPDRIGDYPLVGAAAGLERLKAFYGGPVDGLIAVAPAVEPGVVVDPVPACDDPATSCEGVERPEMPPVPFVQTVTGVHLGLLFTGDALVPAYVFELAEGGSVPVVAVTDEWLDKESNGLTR